MIDFLKQLKAEALNESSLSDKEIERDLEEEELDGDEEELFESLVFNVEVEEGEELNDLTNSDLE